MPIVQTKQGPDRLFVSKSTLDITEKWFSIEYWQALNALKGTATGRGTVWFLNSDQGEFVLRRYRRGGLMAKLTQFRFLFTGFKSSRAYLELNLLEQMQKAGLPVPEPIAGRCQRIGLQYQAEIMTRLIPNGKELFACLLDKRQTQMLNWQDIGKTIKRFHQAGIDHTDLNCHNIMIDNKHKVWLIDFDKCHQRPIDQNWPLSNLQRLKRSFEKEAGKHAEFHFEQAHWQLLLEGYHG